jgi:SAM-dependent methyltransferase
MLWPAPSGNDARRAAPMTYASYVRVDGPERSASRYDRLEPIFQQMQHAAARVLRFDENYYSTVYRDYGKQTPRTKLAFYQSLLDHAMGVSRPGTRLLDVGCAFGDFLRNAPRQWDLVGSDINEYALDEARKRDSTITYFDGAFPPESAGTFDAVTALDVLEHMPAFDAVVEQIGDRLRPGGTFHFVVPVYDGPLGWVVHTLDKDPTHVHKMSRKFWLDYAASRFEIVKWTGIVRWMPPIGSYIHVPTDRLRAISPGIAVLCRRAG